MANELGSFVRKCRGTASLRDFADKCKISHTHLDSIEKGADPRTGKPVAVSTETLRFLADGCGADYVYLALLAAELVENHEPTIYWINNRLKSCRENWGISVQSASQLSGIPTTRYEAIEESRTDPSLFELGKLCDCFKTDIDYMVAYSWSAFPPAESQAVQLSSDEIKLVTMFRSLNAAGNERLLETADDLIKSGKYNLPEEKKKRA